MKHYLRFAALLLVLLPIIGNSQNIFSGEPVQVVGSMNNYNTSATFNTVYRRVSVNSGNPTDGRGQWFRTFSVQASGGNFVNQNMTGGSNNGFLFISGPASNRFQNKWVFSGIGQGRLDSINAISAYNSGNDMGLNLSNPGQYTFVFNDCGYTATNAQFYVGYTAAEPVQLSGLSSQLNANNSLSITFNTNTKPSPTEKVYIRYTTNTSFAAGTNSVVVACNSLNSPADTIWEAIIPAQPAGTAVTYYAFTSTMSVTQLNALSESGKTICALRVLDNAGINYRFSFVPKYSTVIGVDMAGFTCVSFDSVTIIGNQFALGSWSIPIRLKSTGTIYRDTFMLDSGALVQYKFRYYKNGNFTWENNFSTTSTNREYRPFKDSILPNFCFSSLQLCPIFPAPSSITFRVDLSRNIPDPQGRIYVMGNFTTPTWQAGAIRLSPTAGRPGLYETTVQVCSDSFQYKFINGDSSIAARAETFPIASQRNCTVNNGTGGFNRVFVRNNTQPQTLEFMFDSCIVAPIIIKKQIRFNVNMQAFQCTPFDSVLVVGNDIAIGNWSTGLRLKRIGTTNIYSDTISFDSGKTVQYKFRWFLNGMATWESNFNTTGGNRILVVDNDSILNTVCFNQINDCAPLPAPSSITFRVDLSRGTPDAQGRIYVMGNFTSPTWQGGAVRLQPVPGLLGVYETTLQVCKDTILFKFINGDSSIAARAESFPSASQRSCAVQIGGIWNRIWIRTDSLPRTLTYAFDSCAPLPIITKLPVVFKVNLAKQQCNLPDSVTIAGNQLALGNWTLGIKLKPVAGTNEYADTLLLDSGISIQYKFRTHRNGIATWENDRNTFSRNREWIVNADSSPVMVCFNENSNCVINNPPSMITFKVDLSGETIDAQNRVYLIGNFTQPQWQAGALRMQPVNNKPGLFEISRLVCADTIQYKFVNGDSSISSNIESFNNPSQRSCVVSNGVGGFNRILIRSNSNPFAVEFQFNRCSKAEEITISNPIPSLICGNGITTVQYSLRLANYTDTTFIAQLSDVNGSFNQPQNIGNVQLFNQTGQTNLTIPNTITPGNYRIRLVSAGGTIISTSVEITRRSRISVGPINGNRTSKVNALTSYNIAAVSGFTPIWQVNGGTIISGDGTTAIVVRWDVAGNQQVSVRMNDTCSTTSTITVDVCAPVSAGSISGSLNANIGDTVTYQVVNQLSFNYNWFISNNGRIVSNNNSPIIKVIWDSGTAGSVSVSPIVACADTISIQVNLSATGIKESWMNNLSIFPNPFNQSVQIEGLPEHCTIQLREINGKLLQTFEAKSQLNMNTEQLPSGIYLLMIINDQGTLTKKIIKP